MTMFNATESELLLSILMDFLDTDAMYNYDEEAVGKLIGRLTT